MKAAASAGAVAHASKVLDRRPDFIWFPFVVIASLSPCLVVTDGRIMGETG
jgi:hypothetical protein